MKSRIIGKSTEETRFLSYSADSSLVDRIDGYVRAVYGNCTEGGLNVAEWMLDNTFECPYGFVQDYNDCKHQHHEECIKCERWKRILAEKVYLNYLLNEYGVDCLWISVKDRLPTDMGTVLIAHKGGVSFAWFNGTYWTRGEATKHKPLKTITHWMPLPEPPKEG